MEKFAAGVIDTGGKVAVVVVDNSGKFSEFSKKFETVLMEYSGAGGNWFIKKPEAKILVTLSI